MHSEERPKYTLTAVMYVNNKQTSIHLLQLLILFRVVGGPEPIPEAVGARVGTTLDGVPAHCMVCSHTIHTRLWVIW